MGRNKVSNNADHVIYDPNPTKTPKEAPPQPWKMPAFSLMDVTNPLTCGAPIGFDFASLPHCEKNSSHVRFRIDLATDLFRRFECLKGQASGSKRSLHHLVNSAHVEACEMTEKFSGVLRVCQVCRAAKRVHKNVPKRPKRKPLQELHHNNVRANDRRNRLPRSYFGCALCNIALCNNIKCWNEHIEAIWKD